MEQTYIFNFSIDFPNEIIEMVMAFFSPEELLFGCNWYLKIKELQVQYSSQEIKW